MKPERIILIFNAITCFLIWIPIIKGWINNKTKA